MAKKKSGWIRLISTENTGTFYVARVGGKKSEPMRVRKYDRKLRRHVDFKEAKMK
jgi:large subunit ribosomal protein L33